MSYCSFCYTEVPWNLFMPSRLQSSAVPAFLVFWKPPPIFEWLILAPFHSSTTQYSRNFASLIFLYSQWQVCRWGQSARIPFIPHLCMSANLTNTGTNTSGNNGGRQATFNPSFISFLQWGDTENSLISHSHSFSQIFASRGERAKLNFAWWIETI